MRMAAPDSSLWARFKSDHHRTAPTLDQTDTKALWLCDRDISPNGPLRNIFKERSAKTERFNNLVKPHLYACGNIA